MPMPVLLLLMLCVGTVGFLLRDRRSILQDAPDPTLGVLQDHEDAPGHLVGPAATFGPGNIGPAAILGHAGVDYLVCGTMELLQGPQCWFEHVLDVHVGEAPQRWLSVRMEGGELELVLWEVAAAPEGAGKERVEIGGFCFRELDRGRASYEYLATAQPISAGECRYVEYIGTGTTSWTERASWRSFDGGEWVFARGRVVQPGEFTVLPTPEVQ